MQSTGNLLKKNSKHGKVLGPESMWNIKAKIVHVAVWHLGAASKNLEWSLGQISKCTS